MNAKITETLPAPAAWLSAAWAPFSGKLATALGALAEDQCLVLSVKGANRFVQFAAQGSFGLRVETTSNGFLPKAERINARQRLALTDAGWHAPTGSAAEATPERDPDGSPNFFVDFGDPVPFASVAQLTVKTFAEILRVPHPGFLQYEAFDLTGGALVLPDLGLKLARRDLPPDSPEDVTSALLETLRTATGIDDLEFDADGDLGIRFGSALTLVKLVDEPPHVSIASPILRDVEASPELFARLNDINANKTLMHFVFRNDSIYGMANISTRPFVADHVVLAFTSLSAIADGMGPLLQDEFGGQTAYADSIPSVLKH